MKFSTIVSLSRVRLTSIMLIYLAAAAFLIPLYRFQINPDGVAYITVAQKYLAGNFSGAVNGYWSPLLSFLLLPFLSVSIEPLLAAKLLSFVLGAALILGIRLLAGQMGLKNWMADLVVVVSVPMLLYFAVSTITPDLLILVLIMFYLYFTFDPRYSERRWYGVVCAGFGVLIYLAKSYGFPFFLAHFLIFSGIHYFRSKSKRERKVVLTNLASGFGIFCILGGMWIAAISAKYGDFTIGTSMRYNFALAAPDSKGHPIYYAGLIEPEDEEDVSAWEDPSNIEVEVWSPLESVQAVKHQTKKLLKNFFITVRIWRAFSSLAPAILLAAFLICIPPRKELLHNKIFYVLVTLFIYNFGYTLVYMVPRYIWIDILFIVLLAIYFVSRLKEMGYLNRSRLWVTIILLILSFWVKPVRFLIDNAHIGEPIYWLSKEIRDNYDIDGAIVSNANWNKSYYLAFYNGYSYLGMTDYWLDEEDFERLAENGIDHYVFWGDPWDEDLDGYFEFLEDYEEMTDGDLEELKVFRLRD